MINNKIVATVVLTAFALPVLAQEFHGSARVIGTAANENEVFIYDSSGTLTTSYDQIAGARTDAWGYRDGAFDGTNVYFGWGGGVARHDMDGANGNLMIAGAAPGGVGTWRALAYDPTGNGGAGSLWSASFASDLIEVDMSGGLLTTLTNTGAWSLYGLAYDDATGDLLGHHTGGEVIRINTGTGAFVSEHLAGSFAGAVVQGGLSGMSELGGNYAAVSQGAPDELAIYTGGGAGAFSAGPWDMEGQSGSNGHLGVAVTPVPEPASMIALGLGAAALAARRRRKKA